MDKEVKEKKVCRQHVVFCVLVVLYVFVSLLFSFPVHAAESSQTDLYTFKWGMNYFCENYYDREYSFSITVPYKNVFAACNNYASDNKTYILAYYDPLSQKIVQFTDYKKYTSWEYICVDNLDDTYSGAYSNDVTHYSNGFNEGYQNYSGHQVLRTWHAEFPVFKSWNDAINFYKNNDTSGLLNGGSIDNPDFQDTAYAFTGFTANNKMTATWTGTTERSYLKDEDVEEYVRVSYGFAAKDAPDSIKQVDNDSKEYSTAAKSLTVKVSDLVPDDDSWFLRYVQVIPCYRQAGLGVWGDFYHGVACKVYFNQDGSIDKIVRDFPQGSGDYSYKHIFSSDKYSNEIPAPELSAISHNGFTLLNNSNNDYYVDIILESNLYGVKMEKNAGTWLPVVDTDWIYNSHYYNFADTSQIAINNDVIYIPNLFSVNPESDLVDDFKKWSSEYSSYSSLPSMSFLKRSTAARTRYVDQFLFKDNSKYSDSEQLRFSHMAESVFYVRYYNKSMVYGPWVRYKFRDGYVAQVIDGTLGGAYIDVGQVDTDDSGNVRVDENGNPIVSDNVSGRQDYDTGESDFSDGSFSLDLSDVTKFFDYLKKIFESVTGALSSFGSVVAACFGFLPGELVNALIFGICVMMFIGIIKAVKG